MRGRGGGERKRKKKRRRKRRRRKRRKRRREEEEEEEGEEEEERGQMKHRIVVDVINGYFQRFLNSLACFAVIRRLVGLSLLPW